MTPAPIWIANIGCRLNEHTLRFAGEDLIKLEGLDVKTRHGKGKETTITSVWNKATYTRAVFSMAFGYDGDLTPSEENNWYLEANGWYFDLF